MAAEKNELLKEIAFLSNLIHSHKQQSDNVLSAAAVSSLSPKKWTPASWVNQRRVVKPLSSVNATRIAVQTPVRMLAVGAKSRTPTKMETSRHYVISNQDAGYISKSNASATYSSTGTRTVINPMKNVLIKSQSSVTNLDLSRRTSKASSSVLSSASKTKITPCKVPVSQLKVTVTSCPSFDVRAVTTSAPSSNRTVLLGLQHKKLLSSNSSVVGAPGSHRTVCSPPAKCAGRVVLKPTAYKWAANPISPPVKVNIVKPSPPAVSVPNKFNKFKYSAIAASAVSKKQSLSSVPSNIISTHPPSPVTSTRLVSAPLTSTPIMKPSLPGPSPLREKLVRKTIKRTKYTLVRKSSPRTDRKLVRNLYTWFNARPGPATTPRLKRKVGKYSLRYVKATRTLKKAQLLPSSSYRYICNNKVVKNRSVRPTRCRFATSSLSVSRIRSRITQKYKFFKRDSTGTSPKDSLKKNMSTKLVMIGGILYKSSKNKLARTVRSSPIVKVSRLDAKKVKIITVRGVKFRMDSSGKTLQRLNQSSETVSRFSLNYSGVASRLNASFSRVDLGGVTFVETKPGVLVKSHVAQKRTIASQVVNRSIHRLVAANKKSSQYCMFFNRFGKCHKKESGNCPYKHDADKVAVCTRFLQGSCTVKNCLFSHKVCRTKMPACSFFLEGRCSSDDCPYLHVNVNPKAEVCKDFLKGYCSLGEKCKKRHTYVCPEFQRTGKCEKGKKCFLKHNPKPKWKKPAENASAQAASSVTEESVPKKRRREEIDEEDDKNLPFKHRRLPSFIRLEDSDDETESLGDSCQEVIVPGASSPLGPTTTD